MSFQHFRIQTISHQNFSQSSSQPGLSNSASSLSQALGHTQPPPGPTPNIVQGFHFDALSIGAKKGPYGSGDIDDGYTLVFENMDAFQEWRQKEEEEKMVEFVKGDTHGSKAVPPRFKDHTKLVCARHSRSGRKKYVKKFPERVRKVPSRKIEGVGCPASISYKTYFDSEEVRACYVSEHSHEIGVANLPFTRKGRKAQNEQARNRGHPPMNPISVSDDTDHSTSPPAGPSHMNALAGPSDLGHHQPQPVLPVPMQSPPPHIHQQLQHPQFQHAVSMTAPLPPPPPPVHHSHIDMSQERWDRMSVLFQSLRERARGFEYPGASVAALESVLIRLYLESPMADTDGAVPQQTLSGLPMNGMG
ncbi:hypothetical protein BXZ70DRAFT_943130 [Cristinia sonorae]|uniref:Uncharacterized protein n=1 Tax=Cristinia sonorae TaxID=1940300 RepID=A0A8K0XP97_9AGAR|nr:hypothetical protein BXZ70DRAFT_943130 [Cristinia sonorae]